MTYQASHDSLTGLANRALFSTEVRQAIDSDTSLGRSLALIDLDGFRAVNDTFGHSVGDGLLSVVAERLRGSVRPGDLVARLGGDEFAVLFKNVDAAQVESIAGRMLDMLNAPLTVSGHDLCVTASVGLAASGPGDDVGDLMHRADLAMYAAKAEGKGQYAHYSTGMRRTPGGSATPAGVAEPPGG